VHVFVIPSWVSGVSEPSCGIFVLEQARAVARSYPNWTVTFSAVNHHLLDPRLITLAKLRRALSSPRRAGSGSPDGLFHYKRHLLIRRKTLLTGDIEPFVTAHRRHFEAASRLEKPTILHAHGAWPAGAVARALSGIFGVPYVVTEHMSPFPLPEPPFTDATGRAGAAILAPLERADAVVAVSPSLATAMREQGLRRPVGVIPNLVNTEIFRPALRARAPRHFTFLTVSRLTEAKGIADLLRAIEAFRRSGGEARFRIAGPGPVAPFRTLAERLGISGLVTFLGPMMPVEIAAEMQGAQVLIMPARHESFGIVAIEAMACGMPVLATRSGGPDSLITPETGLLVEIAAPEELARGMAAMMARHAAIDAGAIAEHCRSRYGAEIVAEQIASLYRAVLVGRDLSAAHPSGPAAAMR
jgi:glycosyltransferase involved in cell wall biosynthesis